MAKGHPNETSFPIMRALFCLIALSGSGSVNSIGSSAASSTRTSISMSSTLIFNILAQVPCNVNLCTYEKAVERTGSPTITFSSDDYLYSPMCLRVASGTVVTFSGSFSGHPLYSGSYNETTGDVESFAGTIVTTNSGTSVSFTMSVDGPNPYYCNYHKDSGMVGVIYVGDSCAPVTPSVPSAAPTIVENPIAPMSNPVAPSSNPVAPTSQNPTPKTPIASSGIAVQIGAFSLLTILALF